jgi:hypothetical protein
LEGVLEFNASNGTFIRNAIPFTSTGLTPMKLAFDPTYANPSGYLPGALYVGNLTSPDGTLSTTEKYRQSTTGTITKDTSFSLPASGTIEHRSGDSTIFLAHGSSITRYAPNTGAALGTFINLPLWNISDFAFAPDGSAFVLSYSTATPQLPTSVFHFDPNGVMLGTTPVFTTSGYIIAYLPVPEPFTMGILLPAAIALLVSRKKVTSC